MTARAVCHGRTDLSGKRIAITLALVCGAGLLAGCNSVVARVNGVNITRASFHEELERAQGRATLETMILRNLILEKAKASGVMPTADDVQKKLTEMREQNGLQDEAKYREWLKSQALDDKILLDQIQVGLAMEKLRTMHLKPSETDLKRFFDENRAQLFDKPERMSFRQIVLPSRDAALKLLRGLNTEEVMFQEAAKQSMDEHSRESGGLYEEMPLTILQAQAKPVFEVLTTLKENQISQKPVEFQNVFFVVKMIKRFPAEPADYASAETKKLVHDRFLATNAKAEEQVAQEVAEKADVVVLDDRYKGAVEPKFSGAKAGGSALPPAVQQELEKGPKIVDPTKVDDSAAGKMLEQNAKPAAGGALPAAGGAAPATGR